MKDVVAMLVCWAFIPNREIKLLKQNRVSVSVCGVAQPETSIFFLCSRFSIPNME